VHPVGSWCTDISRCTVRKTLKNTKELFRFLVPIVRGCVSFEPTVKRLFYILNEEEAFDFFTVQINTVYAVTILLLYA
jgi:hypothetical protein